MSDRDLQPHPDGSEMSGKSLTVKQSAWMGHWMQPKPKPSRGDNLCLESKDRNGRKQHSSSCSQGSESEPSGLRAFSILKEWTETESRSIKAVSKVMTDGSHSKEERSDLLSFPIFNIHTKGHSFNKQVPGTQTGQCSEFDAATTGPMKPRSAYAFGHQLQEMGNTTMRSQLFSKETLPNLELELRALDSTDGGCMPAVKSSHDKLLGVPGSYPYGIIFRKEKVIPFASTFKDHTIRHSYHDFNIDTIRLASTLDARENIHFGPSMYETTRHFHRTEKMAIGVSDSDEGKRFRESMLSSKFNGNLGGSLSLSSASGQFRPGLKFQVLDGSTDSERLGRASAENQNDEGSRSIGRLNTVGGLTDETSPETRTMEVDASLENNHTPGLAVSRLSKAALRGQSTVSSQAKSTKTGLPDMNGIAQAPDGSPNDGEPSTSGTQSLDMECLISNKDCPSSLKSMPSLVVQPRAEVGSRWVKRLKLGSSYTKYEALGTKSATIEEPSSYEKLRKLSSNLFSRSVGQMNSEPRMDTHQMNTSENNKSIAEVPNQSNDRRCLSTDSLNEGRRNALLSHSWIQRWRHAQNASTKKQLIRTEPCETLKASYDQSEKKTFPSIAAMALMGKAMNGFRPCEFTKKGTFIVWNTNSLPRD